MRIFEGLISPRKPSKIVPPFSTPELMFSCAPRYRPRYETLGRSHIVRCPADYSSAGGDRHMADWYAKRRLEGTRLILMTHAQYMTEPARQLANDTGAKDIILGPSQAAYYKQILKDTETGLKVLRMDLDLKGRGGSVYLTPVGEGKEEYLACCDAMIEMGADGLCISPFVSIEWFSEVVLHIKGYGRVKYHAHNPFANPFDALAIRQYTWLSSVSTDAPFRAAVHGRRYADGATATLGFQTAQYKRWEAEYKDYGLTETQLEDADRNHLQMLRIWNGYAGAVPAAFSVDYVGQRKTNRRIPIDTRPGSTHSIVAEGDE